jgi:hypothetical protein
MAQKSGQQQNDLRDLKYNECVRMRLRINNATAFLGVIPKNGRGGNNRSKAMSVLNYDPQTRRNDGKSIGSDGNN